MSRRQHGKLEWLHSYEYPPLELHFNAQNCILMHTLHKLIGVFVKDNGKEIYIWATNALILATVCLL